MLSCLGGSTLAKPVVVLRTDTAVIVSYLADSAEESLFGISNSKLWCLYLWSIDRSLCGGRSATDWCAVLNEDPYACDV